MQMIIQCCSYCCCPMKAIMITPTFFKGNKEYCGMDVDGPCLYDKDEYLKIGGTCC